ncbi:epimerase family protein SDR39U1 [Neocloeon triangulifer]|uniref:epimerase family protein SDR39U1 n=1 Tax=Neocloeon triangulifer TaxID=2078957 RepID=UPI00286EB876|nr:epimerase family protein SDR39U1 [Neocloeon triangulifer]
MTGTVVLGGGSGFVGTALGNLLRRNGYNIITVSRMPGPNRMSWIELQKTGIPDRCKAVINLAGQNILDPKHRWTEGFKQNVYSSRINTTQWLAEAIDRAPTKPEVFITVSGVGYYKPSETEVYDESSKGGDFDYLSKLCTDWEAAAKLSSSPGVRQVTIRSGVVLGRLGGMVQQLYLPFYLGVGGPVGSGKQFLSWIHVQDITRMFLFAIENKKVSGVLNGVAPKICTNGEFSKAFGQAMWRPWFLPVPEFVLNFAFGSERAMIMTKGQHVVPKRALEYGFSYNFPEIKSACHQLANVLAVEESL